MLSHNWRRNQHKHNAVPQLTNKPTQCCHTTDQQTNTMLSHNWPTNQHEHNAIPQLTNKHKHNAVPQLTNKPIQTQPCPTNQHKHVVPYKPTLSHNWPTNQHTEEKNPHKLTQTQQHPTTDQCAASSGQGSCRRLFGCWLAQQLRTAPAQWCCCPQPPPTPGTPAQMLRLSGCRACGSWAVRPTCSSSPGWFDCQRLCNNPAVFT